MANLTVNTKKYGQITLNPIQTLLYYYSCPLLPWLEKVCGPDEGKFM